MPRIASPVAIASKLQRVERALDRTVADRVRVNLKPKAIQFCGERLEHFRLQVQPALLFSIASEIWLKQRGRARFDDSILEDLHGRRPQTPALILLPPLDELRDL